jgi:hypothetical protein
MVELLCIFAVIVYLLLKFERHDTARDAPAVGSAAAAATSAGAAQRPRPRLVIEGTQRTHFRSNKFVKRFGVHPHAVHDIRMYAEFGPIEAFPAAVATGLEELYARGCAVGAEVMGLLCHGRELKEGEALYFALVDARPEPRVVAFVDKLRLS